MYVNNRIYFLDQYCCFCLGNQNTEFILRKIVVSFYCYILGGWGGSLSYTTTPFPLFTQIFPLKFCGDLLDHFLFAERESNVIGYFVQLSGFRARPEASQP